MTDRELAAIISSALAEDLPDITSDAIFSPEDRGAAHFLVKAPGILAGLPAAAAVFARLDPTSRFRELSSDGDAVEPGAIVATVEGTVRALLAGERTALNLMQRASGIASATRRYVDAVSATRARIVDTRKTAPGLRAFDKYAVVAGGGLNHRVGLFDMFLLKNNHIDRAGSIAEAMRRVRQSGTEAPVMIEVRTLAELEEAAATLPDFILLDNMPIAMMTEAVGRIGGRIPLEASGGITLANVRAVAETGVDRISVGPLTHSVVALDISMRIEK